MKPCSICSHKDRANLETALLSGESSLRTIAGKWSVSKAALLRHKDHITAKMAAALAEREAVAVKEGGDLLDQVKGLYERAMELLTLAELENSLKAAAGLIREARSCLELLSRLEGKLRDGSVVNVLVNPVFQDFKAILIETLAPYPQARGAVVAALERMTDDRT